MTEQKNTKKTVFVIVDLANSSDQQKNTMQYGADLAQHFAMNLVLHPKNDNTVFTFGAGRKMVKQLAKCMSICALVSKQEPGFFTSLADIAEGCNTAMVVVGLGENETAKLKDSFGKKIWRLATKSSLPVFIVPSEVKFSGFDEITIPVDVSRDLQKLNILSQIVDKNTKVHIFVQQGKNSVEESKILNTLRHVEGRLSRADILYEKEFARNADQYEEHLLRFAVKRSKLLLIAMDPTVGLTNDFKDNLQKILRSKQQHFAVMIMKSKDVTISDWR